MKAMFQKSFDTLGDFKEPYCLVPDMTVPPVIHPVRKYAIQRKLAIKHKLSKMQAMCEIKRITEPTDLTFMEKRKGGLRACLNHKDLNGILKPPSYKTPTLEEITGATVFSKMDPKNGYRWVRQDEDSSNLATFNTPFGRYQFRRLPFGLLVSQDVIQQCKDAILERCPGCISVADDVAVYGCEKEEHDWKLLNLMKVAQEEGLVFNIQKCIIRTNEILLFGMMYSTDGACPDSERIEVIGSLPSPDNVTELFLGIVTYMLKQDVEFTWTPAHKAEFHKIKELICQNTISAYFDPSNESVLQVDSSLRGLGVVLMQDGRLVVFASKSLTDMEKRYSNIEQGLLAVVYECERFHSYLYGKPFLVQSDHKPLEMIQLKNLHEAPPNLQCMLLHLQNYAITIQYQPEKHF